MACVVLDNANNAKLTITKSNHGSSIMIAMTVKIVL